MPVLKYTKKKSERRGNIKVDSIAEVVNLILLEK